MTDLNETNEYGVPLHACNGYRQDEHYWTWLRWIRTHPSQSYMPKMYGPGWPRFSPVMQAKLLNGFEAAADRLASQIDVDMLEMARKQFKN